jgi:hypothetical protein
MVDQGRGGIYVCAIQTTLDEADHLGKVDEGALVFYVADVDAKMFVLRRPAILDLVQRVPNDREDMGDPTLLYDKGLSKTKTLRWTG